jgi:hypothetical protein
MHVLQISSLFRRWANDTDSPERGLLMGNTLAAKATETRAKIAAVRSILYGTSTSVASYRKALKKGLNQNRECALQLQQQPCNVAMHANNLQPHPSSQF